jgi:acyl-CoA thioesterase YciA
MQFRTRKLVKPEDLNPRGTLSGGRLLSWIDEECAIYASCQLETTAVVTKYMSEINFLRPAHCGDVVELGADTVKVGTTSLTVRCEVRDKVSKGTIITVDRVVFVALDAQGRPVPHRLASAAAA